MLKRKIFSNLKEWKDKKKKKPLFVEGMRQVGKTFIIDYFAKNEYKQYIYINFLITKKYKEIFSGDLDKESIINKIKLFNEFKNINFNDQLIIFLDEIQECPNAITSLKSLSNIQNIDTIASGSYLGMKFKEISSFPVGYIEILKMYPLDFEEFLWALEINNNIINSLKESLDEMKSIENIIHLQMIDIFKQYILIGGMPDVVNHYIKSRNIYNTRKIQKNIIEMFFFDTMKYAQTSDKQKILECFNSIPLQLAKENKKFMFSKINKNARSKWYYSALSWLVDSNIVNKSILINDLKNPLNAYEDLDSFKIYLGDTGLLCSMIDDSIVEQIMNDFDCFYKGAIFENVISQMLVSKKYKLRYFTRNHTLELDFVVNIKNEIVIIEVKSGNNRSKSLITIINENEEFKGILLWNNNIQKNKNIVKIPWYLLFLI